MDLPVYASDFWSIGICLHFEAFSHDVLQRAELRVCGFGSGNLHRTGNFCQQSGRNDSLADEMASLVISRARTPQFSWKVWGLRRRLWLYLKILPQRYPDYLVRNYLVAALVFCFHEFRAWGPRAHSKPLPGCLWTGKEQKRPCLPQTSYGLAWETATR